MNTVVTPFNILMGLGQKRAEVRSGRPCLAEKAHTGHYLKGSEAVFQNLLDLQKRTLCFNNSGSSYTLLASSPMGIHFQLFHIDIELRER
jgi:hypothetical protein